ncbi:MAG: glycosyltransferase [Candidatus Gastranaerophilales bacterium]|nr:glycosyltransferase [Candidatus Gastranaerophilales bacterium]
MKISIITSAFNAEKYIEETIESVLSQRGDFEIEYIVIEAKSKDATLEKIEKYKKIVEGGFYSERNKGISMKVISESDGGMYEGIAKGLKSATGDIVAYINSDDFYLPNAFSCVCEIFQKFPQVNWLTGRANSFNAQGHNWESVLPAHFYKEYIRKGFYGKYLPVIQQESTFWRRKLLENFNYEEFLNKKLAGDFYLWYSFSKENELYIVNSNLAGFRFSEGQKSENKTAYNKELMTIVNYYKPKLNEKFAIAFLKITSRVKDKKKLKGNPNIIRYDLKTSNWVLG